MSRSNIFATELVNGSLRFIKFHRKSYPLNSFQQRQQSYFWVMAECQDQNCMCFCLTDLESWHPSWTNHFAPLVRAMATKLQVKNAEKTIKKIISRCMRCRICFYMEETECLDHALSVFCWGDHFGRSWLHDVWSTQKISPWHVFIIFLPFHVFHLVKQICFKFVSKFFPYLFKICLRQKVSESSPFPFADPRVLQGMMHKQLCEESWRSNSSHSKYVRRNCFRKRKKTPPVFFF